MIQIRSEIYRIQCVRRKYLFHMSCMMKQQLGGIVMTLVAKSLIPKEFNRQGRMRLRPLGHGSLGEDPKISDAIRHQNHRNTMGRCKQAG